MKDHEIYSEFCTCVTKFLKEHKEDIPMCEETFDILNNVINDISETEYRKYLGKLRY